MRHAVFHILAMLSIGCATVRHGPFQDVAVDSDPPGAAVHVECGGRAADVGVTPIRVSLHRRASSCRLVLTHAGYEDATLNFNRVPDPYYWGNFPLGIAAGEAIGGNIGTGAGFLGGAGGGLLIDWVVGSMWKQTPTHAEVTLKKR